MLMARLDLEGVISQIPPLSSPRGGEDNLAPPLSPPSNKILNSKKLKDKFNIRHARIQQADGWSMSRIADASGYSVQFVTARMRQPRTPFKGGYGNGLLTVGSPDRLLAGLFREHADRVKAL